LKVIKASRVETIEFPQVPVVVVEFQLHSHLAHSSTHSRIKLRNSAALARGEKSVSYQLRPRQIKLILRKQSHLNASPRLNIVLHGNTQTCSRYFGGKPKPGRIARTLSRVRTSPAFRSCTTYSERRNWIDFFSASVCTHSSLSKRLPSPFSLYTSCAISAVPWKMNCLLRHQHG